MSATPVSAERLAEMLAGLEGVTPGPWRGVARQVDAPARAGNLIFQAIASSSSSATVTYTEASANAEHVRNCDPDTIRAMIIELQALRASTPVEGAWDSDVTPEAVQIMRDRAAPFLEGVELVHVDPPAALDQSPTKGAE